MEERLACIRFNSVGKSYYFSTNLDLHKGDKVVVETIRGLELGELITELKDLSEFNLDTELKKVKRKANRDVYKRQVFKSPQDYAGFAVIFSIIFYTIQIYTEFSGCMDIVLSLIHIFNNNSMCSWFCRNYWFLCI